VVAYRLGKDSRDGLIGHAIDPDEQRMIAEEIRSTPGIDDVVELRTMHLGPESVIIAARVAFSDDISADRAEDIAGECSAADERFGAEPGSGRGDEVFPPTPGSWCGWCDFRAQCPEGRDASALRRPWDGLAAEDPAAPHFPRIVDVPQQYD